MMPQRLAAILVCLLFPGCVIIDVGVTNPIPGVSRVAVVPFRNLTSHPNEVVDGRRFAMAYASELQKIPGFEVVAVGVVEVAMLETGLKVSDPGDLRKLAEFLEVDLFVDGAVTDYDPFYPPRIGLTVRWVSPYPQIFFPGVQTDTAARRRLHAAIEKEGDRKESLNKSQRSHRRQRFRLPVTIRGQSSDRFEIRAETSAAASLGNWRRVDGLTAFRNYTPLPLSATAATPGGLPSLSPALFDQTPLPSASETPPDPTDVPPRPADAPGGLDPPIQRLPIPPLPNDPRNKSGSETMQPMLQLPINGLGQPPAATPRMWSADASTVEPLMGYSRFFDGADGDLVAELRDYVELNGDLRSGGWEAYLQRSDDFIRFVCHRMIEEMLTLHGGEARRRIVLKFRKYR